MTENAEDCIFCKIAGKQIDSTIVYEDDWVVAFEDLSPQAPIHTLIIPRRHIARSREIQEKDKLLAGHIVHVAGVIKHLTDYHQRINGLFVPIIRHLTSRHGRHADDQTVFIHAIERHERCVQKNSTLDKRQISQCTCFGSSESQVGNIHHRN